MWMALHLNLYVTVPDVALDRIAGKRTQGQGNEPAGPNERRPSISKRGGGFAAGQDCTAMCAEIRETLLPVYIIQFVMHAAVLGDCIN
jgi:hypothetical protein